MTISQISLFNQRRAATTYNMTWKQPRIFNHLATTIILRTAKPAPSGRLKVKLQQLSSSYGFWPQKQQSSSKSAFRKVNNSTVGELSNKVFNGKFHVKHLLKHTNWIEQQTINLVYQLENLNCQLENHSTENRKPRDKTDGQKSHHQQIWPKTKCGRNLDVAEN